MTPSARTKKVPWQLSRAALYNWLLRAAPVALVSTYAYALQVVAYLVGVLVLGEPFHPSSRSARR